MQPKPSSPARTVRRRLVESAAVALVSPLILLVLVGGTSAMGLGLFGAGLAAIVAIAILVLLLRSIWRDAAWVTGAS